MCSIWPWLFFSLKMFAANIFGSFKSLFLVVAWYNSVSFEKLLQKKKINSKTNRIEKCVPKWIEHLNASCIYWKCVLLCDIYNFYFLFWFSSHLFYYIHEARCGPITSISGFSTFITIGRTFKWLCLKSHFACSTTFILIKLCIFICAQRGEINHDMKINTATTQPES